VERLEQVQQPAYPAGLRLVASGQQAGRLCYVGEGGQDEQRGLKPESGDHPGRTTGRAATREQPGVRHSAAGVSEGPGRPRPRGQAGAAFEGDMRRPEPETPASGAATPVPAEPARPAPKVRRRRPRRGAGWLRGRSPNFLPWLPEQ